MGRRNSFMYDDLKTSELLSMQREVLESFRLPRTALPLGSAPFS